MKLFASGSKQTNQLESTKTFFNHSFIFLICSFCSVVVVGKQNKNKLFFFFFVILQNSMLIFCLFGWHYWHRWQKNKINFIEKRNFGSRIFFFLATTIQQQNETKQKTMKNITLTFSRKDRNEFPHLIMVGKQEKTLFSQLQSDNFIRICFEKFALLIYNEK